MSDDPRQESFGEHLAALLRRQGQTMAQFGRSVRLSASSLSRIRTGQRQCTDAQAERFADALKLDPEARARFLELAVLARTPAAVRSRLLALEQGLDDERGLRRQVEAGYGRFRNEAGFHDGWWLSYSRSFFNDGRIQRSLVRVQGDRAQLRVAEQGRTTYSYHGSFEPLGDKAFLRLAEDRGGVEYVQIVLHSLFDWSRPSFLYGVVCGISGRDLRHPLSHPCAARILLLHIGGLAELPEGSERLQRLEAVLGAFDVRSVRGLWPAFLGDADWIRDCMHLEDEPLDQAILRLVDNSRNQGDVLRAEFS